MARARPFFSIIIPTLNEQTCLPQLLLCLKKQKYRDFEVIVVDGHSTDATIREATKFASAFPIRIIRSADRNVCLQRNSGASKARGTYLAFFDADVTIKPNYFSKLYAVITKKRYVLMATYLIAPDHDPKKQITVALANVGMSVASSIDKPFAGGFNIIVLAAIFHHVSGFDVTVVHSEDHDFVQRCSAIGVRLQVLKNPRQIYSFRRYEAQGYFSILRKYTHSSVYILLYGPIKKALYDYPMGGHVFDKKEIKKRTLEQLEDRIITTAWRILHKRLF